MFALAVALIATFISALLTGRFYRPSSTLHKVLVLLVLFFTYMLLATHLVAGSELIGLIESANSTAVAWPWSTSAAAPSWATGSL